MNPTKNTLQIKKNITCICLAHSGSHPSVKDARCHVTLLGMHIPYAGGQEVHRRQLDNTELEDNAISPHVIFELEDTSEKLFTNSLRTLSQVNQK